MKKGFLAFVMLAVLTAFTLPSFAQEPPGQAPAPQKPETRPLRKELVQLKYVSGADIMQLIYSFFDPGSRLERVDMSTDKKTLTIRAHPENMERVLQVIKELDVKPPDLLFTVQLVMGSEAEEKTDPELQADPIIRELRKLLRYKGYTLLDTSLIRGMDKQRSELILGKQADFTLTMIPDVVKGQPADNIKVELRLRYSAEERMTVMSPSGQPLTRRVDKDLIQSTLSLKSGDKTVVGVSKLDGGDKGLILILSAKVVS